jgi:K+-sensing histidine kinase KdpD
VWRVRALLRQRREAEAGQGGQAQSLLRVQCDELLWLSRRREEALSLLVHDMKNPLSGVISNAEYLSTSQGLDADQLGCAQDILQASRRLHRMVLSLLDVAQSEDGQLRPVHKPIVVSELIDETHAACSARLRDKNVRFEVTGADPGLVLAGDHDMLLRLLANLLDNAAVAAPSGTTVELRVAREGQALELRFSDLGPSVPPAERAALLSEMPPVRTAQDAPRHRGRRGLGLRACRVLVEAHGGRIWVEDRLPRGATIGVRLPLGG